MPYTYYSYTLDSDIFYSVFDWLSSRGIKFTYKMIPFEGVCIFDIYFDSDSEDVKDFNNRFRV